MDAFTREEKEEEEEGGMIVKLLVGGGREEGREGSKFMAGEKKLLFFLMYCTVRTTRSFPHKGRIIARAGVICVCECAFFVEESTE